MAARDFNIDLTQSWMVGDTLNDVKARKAVGCNKILIGDENNEDCNKTY